jgi:hypothetical protein
VTAYTDATKIAAYLGKTLTAPQIAQATVMADAATAWIDRYLGRSWQIASPVTDELHGLVGDTVYLNQRPVAAVSVVKTRAEYADAPSTTLDASQWELLDATNGVLRILGWAGVGALALVTYTHTGITVPADVGLAATMIASAWLGGSLAPGTNGVESIAVGQNDINLKFSASRSDVPVEALSILNGYRQIVVA